MADAAGKMQQVLELLSKFSLNSLDSEWTKSVIDADFTEVGDLPSNFEEHHFSTNLSGLFSAVNNSFRHWVDLLPNLTDDNHRMSTSTLTAENDDDRLHTRFWTELSDDLKKLMTLLFYYCYRGQRYDAREAEREFGIQAASLYFLVLCVPGSNAFRVFHPVMYRKCMETMRLATKLQVGAASPKKGRHSTTARASQRRHQEDQMNTEAEEEEESEATMLTPSEATKLVRSLNVLLHDFLRLTVRFSLKHSPESLDETISILIEVSCSETNNAAGIFVERHGPATTTALAYNSYCSLQSLCCTIHGQKKKIVLLIMKHILHNILMVPRGLSDLSGRSLNVIREHSQIFVKYILMQVKEEAYDGVYILIQHLCLQVPDKAEFRQKAAQSVVEILRFLPTHLYVRLIKWFFKFSHNEKAGHRLFMLEVISKMLGEVERSAEGSQENLEEVVRPRRLSTDTEYQENENSDEEQVEGENSFCAVPVDHPVEIPHDRKLLSHKFLLSIIFSRCRDSAASVRSKALTLLAECTLSTNRTIMLAMQQIFVNNKPLMFTTPHITSNNINLESPVQENEEVEEEELKFPNASLVVSMLRRRALDDKVTVRKSALQVLENLMKLHNDMLTHQNLAVLAEHCRDPALLIRKQMVVSLTTLLEHYPEHDGITTTWIKAVLPLILDPEVKVQERVIEGVDQLLFQRLLPAGHVQEHTPGNLLPWNILTTLTKCSYHKFFNKVLLHWSKMDNSRFQVVNIVKCHIGQEHNEEAWTLLAMLSGYITIKNVAFAVDYFEQHCQNTAEVGSYTLLQVLKVLSNSMKHVPADRAEDLHQQLLLPLSTFSVGAELISSMMDAVTLLTYTLHGDDIESQKTIEKWVAPILKACDEHLKEVLFQRTDPLDAAREEKLYRYLFTMGEAAMLCPQKVNKRMFLMLQSLIFHQQGQEEDDSLPTVPSTQTHCSQPTTITFTPTIRLKALSVVTLGKMCLQHEEQAKRIIPALSRLLSATTHPAIKNNILFTLTDMCVRYATLVDPLMDRVTACLRDPHPQVHRTALTLLISLLQEDYLKLKGSFFYRILQCLTEKDEEMREMVIFYITERLLKRFPKILCQHFIECIFHYNCYEDHETYNRFSQSNLEKEVFSLAGREHSHERHIIYHFMLDHMPDDQRFMTTQRLCQDVLGAVVDGRIKLNKSSMPMLEDTLTILRSDEIKLASLKSRPEDTDQPTDQAEQAVMAGMVIKKTIISQVVKQNVIENIVPILIAVKHKLEEQRSPLMKHLLLYLKELMKDYKNEVREILAGDKQLAKEIEFDLRRFDKEQWEEKNQREENDQRIPSREISNKGSNHDTLGSSPVLRERRLSVVEEQDTSRPSTTCLPPPANIKELHTRAQVFSKDATARRKSVSVAGCVDGIREPTKLLQATVRLRRISIADFREHSCDVFPTREETTHVDPRAIGGYLPQEEEGEEEPNEKEEAMKERMEGEEGTVESAKDESREGPIKNKTRSELLRAISTPSTERTLINNLTFVNETQELSAININSTVASEKSNAGELQLHSTSPTSHKHESDFSRLRKTSKDMQQDPTESSKDKAKGKKKVTGQLFESFEAESSLSEAESTCESDLSAVTAQSTVKRNEGKRTRHVASLSPDPEKNKSNTQTERPKLKKHKKKT